MVERPSITRHAIIITQLRDDTNRAKVAETLAGLSKGSSADLIVKRLDRLPWTITSKASPKNAAALTRMLETLGAKTVVRPPLPTPTASERAPAQTSPEAHVSSERDPTRPHPIPAASTTKNVRGIDAIEAPAAGTRKPPPIPQTPGFAIEPLTLAGMLDKSFQICRSNFWKLLGIVLIPILVVLAITAVIGVVTLIVGLAMGLTWDIESIKSAASLLFVGFALLMAIVVLAAAVIAYFLAKAALIYAVSSIYLGREVRLREAFGFALGRLAPLFLTSLLYTFFLWLVSLVSFIALGIATALLLIPLYLADAQFAQSYGGILLIGLVTILMGAVWISIITYVILKLLLFQEVVIIENVAYTDALKRSWRLLTGKAEGPWPRRYFTRALVLMHIFVVVYLAVYSLFWPLGALIPYLCPESLAVLGQIAAGTLRNVGAQVATLFISVCGVIFYYDIRCRKEGFDLKVLARMDE